jgi:capsular polysaccharide transport system permease protein
MPALPTETASLNVFLRGLQVQARCVHALLIRDMMMRFGRDNIGFLWVVLEPMILTAGVMGVWSIIKPPYEHDVRVISLVLTGYMPLTLWRHMTNAGIFVFRRNLGLLYHRNVSLLDVFISRMLLEFAGTTTALTIVTMLVTASGLVDPPRDLGVVVIGWLLMGAYSFGLALCFAVITEYSEVWERFIQPYQYLMLPISGTFFMVDWLPTFAQHIIWFNPSVHCYEMFRAGFFGEEIRTHFSGWYPLMWSLALLATGIWGLSGVRDRINFG